MTIKELQELVHTLTLERDAAREKIARIMSGLEGCCMTCEPVGVRNQQMEGMLEVMREQVEHYVSERDEARQMYCEAMEKYDGKRPEWIADQYGWDCFKENTND